MNAVRRSVPPKQMLVVRTSPVGHVLQHLAVGRDDGDAAVDERGDAHVAVAVHGERVEELHPGQAGEAHARIERQRRGQLARAGHGPRRKTRPSWVSAQ